MKFDRVSSARGLAGLAVAAVAFGVICAGSERPEASAAAAAAPEVKSPFLPANKPGRFADVKSLMNKGKAPSTMKARMFLGEDLPDPPQHFPVGTSCGIDDALPANCQLPDQGGHGPDGIVAAASDDAFPATVQENLTFGAAGAITSVCWWGGFIDSAAGVPCPGADSPMAFTITYYENSPDCPSGIPDFAAIKAGPFAVGAAGGTATGNVIGSGIGDIAEWSFSAAHAPVPFAAGECFWIEIKNNAGAGACFFFWETGPAGDEISFQGGLSNYDLALCTDGGALGVPDCSLDPIAQCVGAKGACGEAHAGPGCDDPCCCSLVCADDIFCCDEIWDDQCAATALGLGCATFPLCASCDQGGQTPSTENAFNSTRNSAGVDIFIAAEDFTPAANGNITSPCWQGVYGAGNQADAFRIRYLTDSDGDHYPETVLASFTEGAGLAIVKNDTGQTIGGTFPIFQYEGTHAAVAVSAGECYWIEISNDIGAAQSWFWELTERGPYQANDAAPPKQGNGLFLIDGFGDDVTPPDGFNFGDEVPDFDLSFCVGLPLSDPACDFTTLHDTGQHQTVLFNGAPSHLGWSSGNLDNAGLAQRRTAQPFNIPASPTGVWEIRHLLWAGFDPGGGVINEMENFEIHERTSLDTVPTPASLLETIAIPHGAFDLDSERSGFISTELFIDPGTYWLAFWASNDNVPFVASNLAWFTNAHSGVNAFCAAGSPPACAPDIGCTAIGIPKMLRARTYPAPGYCSYTLALAVLDVDPVNDPTPDPNDKYNAEFVIRGYPAAPACPEDCQDGPDGNVGINDLLDLLAQWGGAGPCDFDGGGVGITDLLQLLAAWGPCP